MSAANNRTQSRVWAYLYEHGPSYPRDINVKRSRHAVYQAVQNLLRKQLVRRTHDSGGTWNIKLEVVPGSTMPNDMRGQSPGSRQALREASQRHGRGILKHDTSFIPCALADCWRLSTFPRASGDD